MRTGKIGLETDAPQLPPDKYVPDLKEIEKAIEAQFDL